MLAVKHTLRAQHKTKERIKVHKQCTGAVYAFNFLHMTAGHRGNDVPIRALLMCM